MADTPSVPLQQTMDDMAAWLDALEKANRFAPTVRRAYEQCEWQLDVTNTMPAAAKDLAQDDLPEMFREQHTFWSRALLDTPQGWPVSMASGSATTAATSASTYTLVVNAGEIDDAQTQEWSASYSGQYVQMQSQQQRRAIVSVLLAKMKQDLASEFDDACNSCTNAIGGWVDPTAAGIAMRNTMEHLKGELFARTPLPPPKQKVRWEDMAAGLGSGAAECRRLEAEGQRHQQLHSNLTKLAKNLPSALTGGLEASYTTWLDHLYVILNLVDPRHY